MKKINFGLLAFALGLTPLVKADTVYTFSMNTAPLVGNGPFALDFQLLDGSGSGDGNNTVKLTNLAFGAGGSPSGGGTSTGGAVGTLTSGVTLNDTSFFNEYYENFTAGGVLTFTIDTTNVADAGLTPDLFTVAILDSGLNELPAKGPAGEFLDISLGGGASPQVTTYGSAAGSAYSLSAPTVQVATTPPTLPEPSNYWALLAVLLGFGLTSRVALVRTR